MDETPIETQNGTTGNGASNGHAEPQPTTIGGGKNVVMPSHALGKLKTEARERGKREAMADLERQAKSAGFESLDAMFKVTAALARGQGQGQAQPKPDKPARPERAEPAPREERRDARPERGNDRNHGRQSFKEEQRYQRQLERERRARDEERRNRLAEAKRRERAERRADAMEARMALREQAIQAGVKDVDYVVSLLERSIEGKSEKELEGFDENKFFESVREKQPYLFGEVVRPVTTGTVGRGEAAPPAPGTVTKTSAREGQIDATKMSEKEYRDHMRKRGLDIPGV